jgi:hypothetical protein
VIGKVGRVQDVVVNRRTGRMVDGHLRAALAQERGELLIPVLYGNWRAVCPAHIGRRRSPPQMPESVG